MTLTTLAWLGMAAYFYVTNCIVVALGIALAMLAPTLPLAVLGYTGLILINGVLMHIWPFIRTGGRFSPGLITSVVLFVPLGIGTYWTAWTSGTANLIDLAIGLAIGGATLAFPIAMLIVRSWPYFRQEADA